jgi:hypothetical protein
MAITTFTGDLSAQFPAGTSLEARPASNWAVEKRPPAPGSTPPGSAAATASSNSAGVLSLAGLADSTEYYVSDAAGTRYVRITTFPERQEVMASDIGESVAAEDDARFPTSGQKTALAGSNGTPGSGNEYLTKQALASAGGAMKAEPTSTAYTIWVDRNNGNDANLGNAPGNAVATLEKAISKLQVAGHGGLIRYIGVGVGQIDIAAPIHLVQAITLMCDNGEGVSLNRNFGTPNGRSVRDPVTTAGGGSVQSATAAFTSSDVNRIVSIYRAGVGGGTFYDFISAVPDGTHATLTATTAVAVDASLRGAKMTIVGDWDRVVTDAAMAAGGSVITSAAAAFTSADVGREIVIAGAGQGGQALRAAIKSVSGNTATLTGKSSATISGARCAIGTNFGDLVTVRAASCGIKGFTLDDTTSGAGRIGSPLKLLADDTGSGSQPSNAGWDLEGVRITNTGNDAAGAWEHMIDIDGSWNQLSTGPGIRRGNWFGLRCFGARTPGETIRIAAAVHQGFLGEGIVGQAPAGTIPGGVLVLDPLATAGGPVSTSDVNFTGFEGVDCYYYCEGWNCNWHGGTIRPTVASAGRHAIELSPTTKQCSVVAPNGSTLTGVNADEYDAGLNNFIETNTLRRRNGKAYEAFVPTGLTFETFPRRGASNSSVSAGSSGVIVLMAVWLPGGYSVSKLALLGGGTSLAWGTGWTGQHFMYGLYDPDGNLIAQTADEGGTRAFSNTLVPLSITRDGAGNVISSVRAPRTGLHYIALLINSGTGGSGFTYPTFGGVSNGMATAAPVLCATSGSGKTALDTSLTIPPVAGAVGVEVYGGVA